MSRTKWTFVRHRKRLGKLYGTCNFFLFSPLETTGKRSEQVSPGGRLSQNVFFFFFFKCVFRPTGINILFPPSSENIYSSQPYYFALCWQLCGFSYKIRWIKHKYSCFLRKIWSSPPPVWMALRFEKKSPWIYLWKTSSPKNPAWLVHKAQHATLRPWMTGAWKITSCHFP